jgi:hypothetical protein
MRILAAVLLGMAGLFGAIMLLTLFAGDFGSATDRLRTAAWLGVPAGLFLAGGYSALKRARRTRDVGARGRAIPRPAAAHVETTLSPEELEDREKWAAGGHELSAEQYRQFRPDVVRFALAAINEIADEDDDLLLPDELDAELEAVLKNNVELREGEELLYMEQPDRNGRLPLVATTQRLIVPDEFEIPWDALTKVSLAGEDGYTLEVADGAAYPLSFAHTRTLEAALGVVTKGYGCIDVPTIPVEVDQELSEASAYFFDASLRLQKTLQEVEADSLAPAFGSRPEGVAPKKNEQFFRSMLATLYEPVTTSEWVAGSAGINVRVSQRVSLRLGAMRGRRIDSTSLQQTDRGSLYISDWRIVFVGKAQFIDLYLDKFAVESSFLWLSVTTSHQRSRRYMFKLFGNTGLEAEATLKLLQSRYSE